MVFTIILIAIAFLIGFWNITIAILGLFPKCRATAVGTLIKSNTQRNVPARGGNIPILTQYTYRYCVKGKEYLYSAQGCHSKRRLYLKVPLVFVKWFPRRAYPNKFKGSKEWTLGIFMLLMGLLLIVAIAFTPH